MEKTIPSPNNNRYREIIAQLAKPYKLNAAGEIVSSKYPDIGLDAGGGIISTVDDLAKFDMAMDRNLLISKKSKEQMYTPTISGSGRVLPYGMGWFVQENKDKKLIWHYGYGGDSCSSLILKIPAENLSLILLANSDGASASFNLDKGNVLTSSFAVQFIKRFTNINIDATAGYRDF